MSFTQMMACTWVRLPFTQHRYLSIRTCLLHTIVSLVRHFGLDRIPFSLPHNTPYLSMPTTSKKAKAKAKAQATAQERAKEQKARSRAAAKVKTEKIKLREHKKIQNKLRRRETIRELNTLAVTVGAKELRVKDTPWQKVERLLGMLDGRCQETGQRALLRSLAEQWVACGGNLSHGLRSADGTPADDTAPVALAHHRIIEKGFRIQTHAFMVTYNSATFTVGTWETYEPWFQRLAKNLGAHAWAACLEESQHTTGPKQRYHLHGYLLWKGGDGFIRKNTDELVFGSVRPRVDVCIRTNPARLHTAALEGLYYVNIMKSGTVSSATNCKPWRDYTPKAEWIDTWWTGKKLTSAQYIEYAMEFRCGFSKRRRDWEEVVRSERDHALDAHLREERTALGKACPEHPMRPSPIADTFVDWFRKPQRRRPVLAIIGGTNLGKSVFAAKVLDQVAELLSVPSFLEVTVEDDLRLDLSEFDVAQHAGVLLDGVGDALMIKQHREALQGRAKKCRGGKSATMIYSYAYTLCRRAVVVTLDLSANNLHLFDTDHWLSNPKNVMVLHLTETAFVTPEPAAPTDEEPMAKWSVAAVSAWLESSDMAGPAATLKVQGVSGMDLVAFQSASDLARDLGTTPFVAKKVFKLRNQHIYGLE